ncbi:hypothetical protein KIPB_001457, partial [Kipferlia bialata]|eukprot:g1457.t1
MNHAFKLCLSVKAHSERVKSDLPWTFPESVIQTLLGYIKAHMGDNSTLCQMLRRLHIVLSGIDLIEKGISLSVLTLALTALSTYICSGSICEVVMLLLGKIGQGAGEDIRQLFVDSGVIPASRTALDAHPSERLVVNPVFLTLAHIAESASTRPPLVSSGCHVWALEAMSRHIQDDGIVTGTGTLVRRMMYESVDDEDHLVPTVVEFLMEPVNLRTLLAAMNLHMDSRETPGVIMGILEALLAEPELYPRLEEFNIPDCVQRYGKTKSGMENVQTMADYVQATAALSKCLHQGRATQRIQSRHRVLSGPDLESVRQEYLCNHRYRDLAPPPICTVPEKCAMVLYLPPSGKKWPSDLCK